MPRAFFIASLSLCLCAAGCSRTVMVTEQMTWECAPEEYNSHLPGKPGDYARLRYVKNPHCVEGESANNLCTVLRNFGKPIVGVEFRVHGGSLGFFAEGYEITKLEGQPFVPNGGNGYSGSTESGDTCPIGKVIKSLR